MNLPDNNGDSCPQQTLEIGHQKTRSDASCCCPAPPCQRRSENSVNQTQRKTFNIKKCVNHLYQSTHIYIWSILLILEVEEGQERCLTFHSPTARHKGHFQGHRKRAAIQQDTD